MPNPGFAPLVSLACHDLRTPLATVTGFAKTLRRGGTLAEREERFAGLIEAAADQMAALLDLLGLAARIESGRYEPVLAEADTRELALSPDERVHVVGDGEAVQTDADAVRRALGALARAAAVYGAVPAVTWTVAGRSLALAPLEREAPAVVTGEAPRDLGALVARMVIERLGGGVELAPGELRVRL
ncbi:MAG TPA: histidine kinase dimerization/phospho-acceptor domain-containing protein [Gaiellaceae bacterium]|nr:histidine kinase dimerization/phospho-acceptor domain-containing protein [Gaiellaceae bacterium]